MIGITIAVSYTCALLALAAAVRSMIATRKLSRLTLVMSARVQQAAEDRVFVEWSNWTMLTVTDQQGYIHAATLRQLYTTGQWDHVWDAPIAVAIWHGNPDVVTRYNTELDQEEKRA